ncbi:hypothetical protein HPB52_023632 [Rhipicephalus sanguineus]|uniref:CRAL-TRIO domain-containing protein n=1 Tax=Rhipicephalus sanguineus TaxID=34632 RepID=A0A9D4PVJ9_RHISA|nr:hypothetical protein HPB52_023632 [Rhipicephalus sanguineus]
MLGTYTKRSTEDVYDTSEGALPFRLQRIAEDDLGETPARRKESLEKLTKLISGTWNPCEVTHAVFQRACLMCLELMTSDPSAQTLGLVLLLDCHDFRVENALYLKPGLIKKGLEYVQDSMPSRLKAFHVVRQTQAFDILYGIMKPFLKTKLTRRFHGENFESLHKDISPEQLPAQFGGQAPPLDYDAFWNKMDELEDAFKGDNYYGYSKKNIGDFATQEEVEEALEFL